MQKLTVNEVRSRFLNYFLEHDHRLIPHKGMLPINDLTLLFINSGMAPMKPFFLGREEPPYPQLTNVQNCIRTSDIDDVGDSYHGSSFRMMGSWSFGSYFKERAIELAFDLITQGFGFPADRLSATVFGGDASLPGLPADEESAGIWANLLGSSKVVGCPAADNFWGPAGEIGPCGPCTEVFYDRGPEYGDPSDKEPLKKGRHIEIWNAGVFMMYDKTSGGILQPLPRRCVDTGAGLERFAMLLQDTPSIHEVDQYLPAYQTIYDLVHDTRWARIVLDHMKTSAIIFRCGVFPTNQREGYILRRLLRRIFSGLYLRGVSLTQVNSLFDAVCAVMDTDTEPGTNPADTQAFAQSQLSMEAGRFGKVLKLADKLLSKVGAAKELPAQIAFELKATHGIPEELMQEYCREKDIVFPSAEFTQLFEEHRAASRPQEA